MNTLESRKDASLTARRHLVTGIAFCAYVVLFCQTLVFFAPLGELWLEI